MTQASPCDIVKMASSTLLGRVLTALQNSDMDVLRNVYTELSLRLASTRMLESGEHFPLIGKSLYRDIMAETTFVPEHVRRDKSTFYAALR